MNYTEEILYKSNRTGTYFKTKEEAEKAGLCKCGTEKEKNRIYCNVCEIIKREEQQSYEIEQFYKKKAKNWDGKVKIVYDNNTDMWFSDIQDFKEYYETEKISISDARLVEGIPNYLSEIETDYWDDIADEFEFSEEFLEALNKLNKIAVKEIGCYYPDGCRIDICA